VIETHLRDSREIILPFSFQKRQFLEIVSDSDRSTPFTWQWEEVAA
jgi:hypothetical protein